ncbi:metal-dependent hydrolase [Haloplanus aerogenes]|uniref:LexA-binding, inner membrane-associated putative hydrolase n=1 Tax=Haloplanus aerogenes TaxID=660522 RepID=A0A3M0CZD7_9EURY|nr:metal-dependent hydrolase [Haloplanus aerogenes]AZH25107.1 metal-dependent hydrolase [Haloplanus aerogenes]RMB13670.1 LexA-binding, inner membrane-associated putative hydrolase [Haloplanus aerogenes]
MNKEGHVLNAALLSVGLGVVLVWPTTLTVATVLETLEMVARLTVPIVLGALFPDVDTAFGRHRKTLHNVFVLGVVAAYPIFFDNLRFVWIGVATHYLLDVVGSRRGIAFFYPLTSQEWGLPLGVTTSSKYANPVTVVVTILELAALGAVNVYVMPLASVDGAMSAMLLG